MRLTSVDGLMEMWECSREHAQAVLNTWRFYNAVDNIVKGFRSLQELEAS